MKALAEARALLEELGLEQASAIVEDALQTSRLEKRDYLTFLLDLLHHERVERQRRNVEVRTKLAHLPYRKTLEEFDFAFQPSLDECIVRELSTMNFVTRQENVLLLGPPGVGKSHLAVAFGVEAIRQGLSVYFVSLAQMMNDLRKAYEENRLERRMRVYLRPKLLIVDEVGYMPLDPVAANLFFHVVSARYERGSMVMTSNKSFGEWGELLGDRVLATAVLDRLLHHAHILNIRGNSYRMKGKLPLSPGSDIQRVGQF
jgi:DNA replication protein DnaC